MAIPQTTLLAAAPEQYPAGAVYCPACCGNRFVIWGEKGGYVLSRCRRCGVIFTCLEDGGGLSGFYDSYYDYSQFEIPDVVTASLERLVRSFEPLRRTGRWLDIGFGEGGVLRVAERHGWSCYGLDIAPQALEYGARRGWVVAADAATDDRFPEQGFDVITMIEFIEHVPQSAGFFQMAKRLLRPGGLLYLTTPNAASLNRRLLGLEWSIFSPPEHVTIWTAKGVAIALAAAGFQCRRVRTEGFNPYEIVTRYRPQKPSQEVLSRNQAGLALNSAFSSSPFRRALKLGINQCLSVLRAGDSLKVWATRH